MLGHKIRMHWSILRMRDEADPLKQAPLLAEFDRCWSSISYIRMEVSWETPS